MMIWIIAIVCTVVGVLWGIGRFIFFEWIKPKFIMKWYQSTLEGLGLKVITIPFQPFKIPLANIHKYHQKENKDAFYQQKNDWPKHDIVLTNTGKIITLIILKPRLLQALFSPEKQQLMSKAISNKIGFNLLLKDSLILNQGDYWKRKRKIFASILSHDFIMSKVTSMVRICENSIEQIQLKAELKEEENHRVFKTRIKTTFQNIVSGIVVKMFFGADNSDLNIDEIPINQYITEILGEARDHSSEWTVMLFGQKAYNWSLKPKYRSLKQKIQKLRETVKDILQKKMQYTVNSKKKSYSDLFEALYHLKEVIQEKNQLLSIDEFISQFCAFTVASNDSTGNYLNMLFYYLSKNPEVFQKLKTIVKNNFKSAEDVTYFKVRDIDYLQWCLKETTRMYGPGTGILLRQVNSDTYIDNIPVFKGTGFKIQMLASHYNSIFYQDPWKFDPDRWQAKDPSPFTFGGFGFGPHACLGKSLAILITKITTILFLLKFDKIEMAQGQEINLVYRGSYQAAPFLSNLWVPRETQIQIYNNKAQKARLFEDL